MHRPSLMPYQVQSSYMPYPHAHTACSTSLRLVPLHLSCRLRPGQAGPDLEEKHRLDLLKDMSWQVQVSALATVRQSRQQIGPIASAPQYAQNDVEK